MGQHRALRVEYTPRGYEATVTDESGEVVGRGTGWVLATAVAAATAGVGEFGVAMSDGSVWIPRCIDVCVMGMRDRRDDDGAEWSRGEWGAGR